MAPPRTRQKTRPQTQPQPTRSSGLFYEGVKYYDADPDPKPIVQKAKKALFDWWTSEISVNTHLKRSIVADAIVILTVVNFTSKRSSDDKKFLEIMNAHYKESNTEVNDLWRLGALNLLHECVDNKNFQTNAASLMSERTTVNVLLSLCSQALPPGIDSWVQTHVLYILIITSESNENAARIVPTQTHVLCPRSFSKGYGQTC